MDARSHWERVYRAKAAESVGWYAPHLARFMELIRRAADDLNAAVIDVGGGESTLADDLLVTGYTDVTVFDISATAIEATQQRLGPKSSEIHWIVGDVTNVELPHSRYDVWHDRAVFHFLTDSSQRAAYITLVEQAVNVDGHVVIATFGPDGPTRCSGLDVRRYDSTSLRAELGIHFRLEESFLDTHRTPSGIEQQFLYCSFVREV